MIDQALKDKTRGLVETSITKYLEKLNATLPLTASIKDEAIVKDLRVASELLQFVSLLKGM